MKILIANTLYFPEIVGGAEISTQILAEGLADAGVEVCVVCATGTGRDRVEILNGVTVYYLKLINLYWPHAARHRSPFMRAVWHAVDVKNFMMVRKLEKIIRHERPDIVSTSNLSCLSTGIWRIARDAGMRIVHTARDYYLMCPTSKMFTGDKCCKRPCRMCSIYAQPKRAASAQVDVAIGVSRYVLEQHLENGFFPEAGATGVIHDCYLPLHAESASVAPILPEKPRGITRLGILGRVSPEKGIELVIEQLIQQQQLDWQLLIGGTGDPVYIASLKRNYPDSRVVFMGHLDPELFFRDIDILVVPSKWHEPFGRVTVEAYSHGIPVIGAMSGGIPEVIEPHSALLFDPNQPDTLIATILTATQLMRDPNLKPVLLKRADEFSPAKMIQAYLDVYREVLARQPGNVGPQPKNGRVRLQVDMPT